mmetsp:Transcript_43999/g.106684  ORF Transcript_43999/g.106684 Transcript_43999/m.106684 type:complete len:320 (+) Transcript_43999:578-1537(+)
MTKDQMNSPKQQQNHEQQQQQRQQRRRRPSSSAGPQHRLQEKTGTATSTQHTTSNAAPATATEFLESVKQVFAPCGGVVDAASFILGNCRGSTKSSAVVDEGGLLRCGGGAHGTTSDDIVYRLRERGAAVFSSSTQRRQGETLEFPANGGFDDDVSAISAHTLEEMERLRMAAAKVAASSSSASALASPSQPFVNGQLHPATISHPSSRHHGIKKGMGNNPSKGMINWQYSSNGQKPRNSQVVPPPKKNQSSPMISPLPPSSFFPPGGSDDMSIGVSTSGSASTNEDVQRELIPAAATVTPEAPSRRKFGFGMRTQRAG